MSRIDGGLGEVLLPRLRARGWLVQRVETGGTGRGIADSWWCAPGGVSGWLELKGQASRGAVALRPEQVAWLSGVRRRGGRADVAVRLLHHGGPRRGPPCDELWLLRGDPRDIRLGGTSSATAPWVLGCWGGGPSGWDCDAVAEMLLS